MAPEELGGVTVHNKFTGQIDQNAATEEECINQLKTYFEYMPQNAEEPPTMRPTNDDPNRRVEEVYDILPEKSNRVYDMKKIIQVLVDDGEYYEVQPKFGKGLITVLAHLNGQTVGIIAWGFGCGLAYGRN